MFSNPEGRYILKGGSGLLARIPGARSTRDLDFAARPRVSAEDALREMEDVAALDLGDFCRFVLTRHEEAMDENGYSRLLKLRFAAYVGEQEKDPIPIDLSLDCTPTLPPERMKPLNRIELDGLPWRFAPSAGSARWTFRRSSRLPRNGAHASGRSPRETMCQLLSGISTRRVSWHSAGELGRSLGEAP